MTRPVAVSSRRFACGPVEVQFVATEVSLTRVDNRMMSPHSTALRHL